MWGKPHVGRPLCAPQSFSARLRPMLIKRICEGMGISPVGGSLGSAAVALLSSAARP